MTQENKLEKTREFIEQQFKNEASGHDWWHIWRVCQMATKLASATGANLYITEMAALLHDLDDWKLSNSENLEKAAKWLNEIGEEQNTSDHILEIIHSVSYKGAAVDTIAKTLEAQCVQDADRLDAIGAIGIARTFAYGGNKGHEMYNPRVKPKMHESFEAYKNDKSHTINHFYEKLLLLKDRMNTPLAKQIALQRHAFMMVYLDEFFEEWIGNA